jgi:outer membrane lipoprotein-sorting protein
MKKLTVLGGVALLAFSICLMLGPAGGSAQTWADVSKKLLGECAKFDAGVKDLKLVMETTIPSSEGSMKTQSVLYRKGNRFRAEINLEGIGGVGLPAGTGDLQTVVVGDGTNVWIIVPAMGKSKIPADEGGKYRGQWVCTDYVPADAEIVGSETIGGRRCFVLAVLDPSSETAKLWVDQGNLALLKLEGRPSNGDTMTVLFSDHRSVAGGFEFAYRADVYSGEELITTVVVESLDINSGLADELFNPDAVKVDAPETPETIEVAPDSAGAGPIE